jgi:CxxC-x17-CxxC domain-containing protein
MTQESVEKSCVVCGKAFLLPAAERRFRAERGLPDPQACPECRSRSRAARNADLLAFVGQNGNGDSYVTASASHRRTSAPRGRNGSGGDGPSQRYPAVCAACGTETMVPFVPRGDRPVYCRDCFNARKGR